MSGGWRREQERSMFVNCLMWYSCYFNETLYTLKKRVDIEDHSIGFNIIYYNSINLSLSLPHAQTKK